jgi:hypothetical protein
VWLLDAALQCQPVMFTAGFATRIIESAAAGNPAAISAPMTWSAHMMVRHIVAANTGFALIQFAIGIGLLFRRTTKAALAASIAWPVAVWWFGEGLGGILAGASPLTGAPGAVLLYALIAALIWPPARDDPGTAGLAPALRGPAGPLVPKLAWLALWGGSACYLLLPGNRAPDAISRIFAAAPTGRAGWARLADASLASATAGHGLAVSVLLAALCALTGIMIFPARLACPAVLLACLLGWTFWLAEGFGGLATGQATDPNTGPLLILLAACFWPPEPAARQTGPGPPPTARAPSPGDQFSYRN